MSGILNGIDTWIKSYKGDDTSINEHLSNYLIDTISGWSKERVTSISRKEISILSMLLGKYMTRFMIAKNKIILGGINQYIDDFYNKDTIGSTIRMGMSVIGIFALLNTIIEKYD